MAAPIGAATAALGVFAGVFEQVASKSPKIQKELAGPWDHILKVMTPAVGMVAQFAGKLETAATPAIEKLATAGAQVAAGLLRPLTAFISSGTFAQFISQMSQVATAIAPLLGQVLVQLLSLFMRLFTQLMPAGVQILTALLPLFVRLLSDLTPVIVAVASLVAKILEWLQHTHLLIPLLGVLAAVILALEAPTLGVIAAVGVLIAVGVELSRHWHQIWSDILGWVSAAWNWIRGHWPLLLGILTGPIGLAAGYIVSHFAAIRNFIGGIVRDIAATWDWLVSHIQVAISGIQAGVNSVPVIGNIAQALGYATGGIVGAAAGGVHGGLRLVGEHGPELVRLPQGSVVRSAADTAGMLGRGGRMELVLSMDPSGSPLMNEIMRSLRAEVRVLGGDPAMFQQKVAFR